MITDNSTKIRRYRDGKPAEPPIPPIDYADDEPDEGMEMLAYMMVAVILVCAAMGIGFVLGWYLS